MQSRKDYVYSGMNNDTIDEDIASTSTITKSGMGSLTINGNIDADVTITFSGMGNLILNGLVDKSLRITMSGHGSMIFANKPPQSVLDNITKTGYGSIMVQGRLYVPPSVAPANQHTAGITPGNYSAVTAPGPDGRQIYVTHGNGTVNVTQNGKTTRYVSDSNTVSITNDGEVLIDGQPLSAYQVLELASAAPVTPVAKPTAHVQLSLLNNNKPAPELTQRTPLLIEEEPADKRSCFSRCSIL